MKKHQKHTKLIRPNLGNFGRNETAIVGAPCGEIQNLAFSVIQHLSTEYKVAYADADHASFDKPEKTRALEAGAYASFNDHNVFERFDFADTSDKFEKSRRFAAADLVLINGNHFAGQKQVVIIHPKKAASLQRKQEKLTAIELILLAEGETNVPAWLKSHLGENAETIPTFRLSDKELIFNFFEQKAAAAKAPLYGLVLAGGKSVRMGKDKGAISYHGKPQREYVYDLLSKFCDKTYLSGRAEQAEKWVEKYPVIQDTFTGLGPYGAILSAFRENPNAAWLCVACDLPLLDNQTLERLVKERRVSENATAFHNSETGFPEPLITIWEPKSYPVLLHFLSLGYSCPRKVLINSSINEVRLDNEDVLLNVNKKEDLENPRFANYDLISKL